MIGRLIQRIMVATVLALCSPAVMACSVCFGKSDSDLAKGMNMGILSLLIVITSVLIGVASFFFFLVRRASRMELAALQSATQTYSEPHDNLVAK